MKSYILDLLFLANLFDRSRLTAAQKLRFHKPFFYIDRSEFKKTLILKRPISRGYSCDELQVLRRHNRIQYNFFVWLLEESFLFSFNLLASVSYKEGTIPKCM